MAGIRENHLQTNYKSYIRESVNTSQSSLTLNSLVSRFCWSSEWSMADFDAIYEDEQLEEHYEDQMVAPVPEPIIIRGAGNMTV